MPNTLLSAPPPDFQTLRQPCGTAVVFQFCQVQNFFIYVRLVLI